MYDHDIVPSSSEMKSVGINSRLQDHVYDSLIRVDGSVNLGAGNSGVFGAIAARSQLFVRQGADISISNLTTGGFFPSDQTFVTLAVRVWTLLRRPFCSNTDVKNQVKSVNISLDRDNTEPSSDRNVIAGVESKTEYQTGMKSIDQKQFFSISLAPYDMRAVMCSELHSDVQIAGEILRRSEKTRNKTDFRVNMEMIAPTTNTGNNNMPGVAASAALGSAGNAVHDRVVRVHKLYHQAENQLFWQLTAGDKPQLTHFTAYTPMAGGLDGFFADSHLPRANNGVPTSSALMRLARPVLIPPRQGFNVVAIISAMGTAVGASLIDQLNGQAAGAIGGANVANAADSIEKDVNTWRPAGSNVSA